MTAPIDLAAVQACEERLVNLWPAVDTVLWGDWVVRFANGYSGRANSASAIRAGATLSDGEITAIVALYRAAGLPASIRVTPLAPPDLADRLEAAGWRLRTTSIGMIGHTSAHRRPDPAVQITPAPTRQWLDGVSGWQDASKRNPAHLAAIVGRIRLPVGFATLSENNVPLAYGMVALDRGMAEIGSIIVSPDARGKGFGRRLVTHMIGWAATAGASRVFLQVEGSNQTARSLYRSLGFDDVYAYSQYVIA